LIKAIKAYLYSRSSDRSLPVEEPLLFKELADHRLRLFRRYVPRCQVLEGFVDEEADTPSTLQIREVNMARSLNACISNNKQELYERLFREVSTELEIVDAESYRMNLSILYAQFLVDIFIAQIKRDGT
jgi:hypothetical protein